MAHAITGLRLLAVVPAAWAFSRADRVSAWLLVMLVAVAIASDYADGIVARRTGSASPRGMLFDHTTDCLFVTAGLAGAAMATLVPLILPVLIPIAFTQYVLDSYFLHRQRQLRMSSLGRWNGIFYFAPLVMIAVAAVHLPGLSGLARILVRPCAVLLAVSTVASIIDRAIAPFRRLDLRRVPR
ncbi:MAG TPA: CDP-alcohol phosphatidyltransferase family protein [Vicinamibacterales bacterium]|nr:CDP-alcohol phosphatidyltransferase family protein [Vicinamibacterales bacterium]